MAELKIEFSKVYDVALEEEQMEIADILNKVLLDRSAADKITDLLLSYHSDDGGAMKIMDVALEWANYDAVKKVGKIGLGYHLGYYYTCSESNKDYYKKDTVDFMIDKEAGMLVLTFMDLAGRSTAEEF